MAVDAAKVPSIERAVSQAEARELRRDSGQGLRAQMAKGELQLPQLWEGRQAVGLVDVLQAQFGYLGGRGNHGPQPGQHNGLLVVHAVIWIYKGAPPLKV